MDEMEVCFTTSNEGNTSTPVGGAIDGGLYDLMDLLESDAPLSFMDMTILEHDTDVTFHETRFEDSLSVPWLPEGRAIEIDAEPDVTGDDSTNLALFGDHLYGTEPISNGIEPVTNGFKILLSGTEAVYSFEPDIFGFEPINTNE
ncbi:hypothetical protein HK104_010228 [Borealophlyctis nickersoniae]|nr:hypothetical protein HK104_010228 [Borealophlyctis nickersoniae]